MPYQIKKAEKISDVVGKLDIPYALIKHYNPYVESEDGVYEGAHLTLPRAYTVLPGETYDSICREHRIQASYLKKLNPYLDGQPSVIYPGQTVFLPARIPGRGD